ncbi:MAG: hypothetical protein ACM3ML_25655 [Micromonosporaceae bacterium]
MAARTRGVRDATVPRRPDTGGNVVSALAVAAGYGLAVSAFTVMMIERVFGPRSQNGRLAVLAMTVGALVFIAAVARARRSLQRRRLGG